ncbi:hypothetical protein [Pseudonocardia sp. TRM90224]|uniref:hypothetical protein n=1 Tax=Pseudonocardia sp. TRM90224 TaxID=2812678 RepID=UPI001E4917F8|nr:hypothetical protein [Pseudonocardia sp. TRM90224]
MLNYGLDVSDIEHDRALPDLAAEGDELDVLVAAATSSTLGETTSACRGNDRLGLGRPGAGRSRGGQESHFAAL